MNYKALAISMVKPTAQLVGLVVVTTAVVNVIGVTTVVGHAAGMVVFTVGVLYIEKQDKLDRVAIKA